MSIGANIVEGRGKTSEAEFARYLRSSINSANELEYHLIVARDLNAISKIHYLKLTAQTIEVRKMLYGLLDRINARKAENANQENKKSRPQGESLSQAARRATLYSLNALRLVVVSHAACSRASDVSVSRRHDSQNCSPMQRRIGRNRKPATVRYTLCSGPHCVSKYGIRCFDSVEHRRRYGDVDRTRVHIHAILRAAVAH